MTSPRAVNRVELVKRESVEHVVIIAPIEHLSGLFTHKKPSLIGEGPVHERGDAGYGGHVTGLTVLVCVGKEEEEVWEYGPQEVGRCCHQQQSVHHRPPVNIQMHQY